MTKCPIQIAATKIVKMKSNESDYEKRDIEIERMTIFLEFFDMVRQWRESLPPGHQIIPKPIKTKYRPYRIDEQPDIN